MVAVAGVPLRQPRSNYKDRKKQVVNVEVVVKVKVRGSNKWKRHNKKSDKEKQVNDKELRTNRRKKKD